MKKEIEKQRVRSVCLTDDEWAALEILRQEKGLTSRSAVVRKLVQKEAGDLDENGVLIVKDVI